MRLKTRLQYSVTIWPPKQRLIDEITGAAWRFAYGVMQPWSVQTEPNVGCDCPAPDALLQDCTWHGITATKMCMLGGEEYAGGQR
jgi:hypothetical protein